MRVCHITHAPTVHILLLDVHMSGLTPGDNSDKGVQLKPNLHCFTLDEHDGWTTTFILVSFAFIRRVPAMWYSGNSALSSVNETFRSYKYFYEPTVHMRLLSKLSYSVDHVAWNTLYTSMEYDFVMKSVDTKTTTEENGETQANRGGSNKRESRERCTC